MPLRNIVILTIAILASLACYHVAARNRYANLMAEALELVESEALYPKPADELFVSAMKGMLNNLDEYSDFFYGRRHREMENDMDQEFGGAGIQLEFDPIAKRVVVLAAIPDTPAFHAGILPGDMIVKVDGEDVTNKKQEEISEKVRGRINTPVKLTLERNGDFIDKQLVRAAIQTPSVLGDFQTPDGKWDFCLKDYPEIGYIRINLFGKRTASELEAAIDQLPPNARGLIIDLRNNTGGLLDAAVKICDFFLPEGHVIVSTRSRHDATRYEYATRQVLVRPDLPVVILINRHSASASEIVAGCLQDHGRAIVMGEQSYGKAMVQNLIQMQKGMSSLKLTTASYWRPSEQPIDRHDEVFKESKLWGILPNEGFEVKITERDVLNLLRDRSLRDLEGLMGNENGELLETVRKSRKEMFRPGIETSAAAANGESPEPDVPTAAESEWDDIPLLDATLQRAIEYLQGHAKMNKKERDSLVPMASS